MQVPSGLISTDPHNIDAPLEQAALKRASVRGAAVSFGAQGLRFVLQFGAQITLAHLLLPRAFGLIAMVAPVLSLVQVFNDLGLTQATVQRPRISHHELSTLFWINVVVSLGLACMLAGASPAVAWFYQEPRLIPITLCCGGLLVLSGVSAQQIALMNRRMRFGALATIDISCAIVAFVVGVGAAVAGAGYWALVAMQAGNSITILVLAWTLSDWRPSWPQGRGQDGAGVGSLLRFGGHLTGFNILQYVETNLGTVLIGRFDGTAALGLYDRAYKLVIVPWWQISLPLDRVAVSLLSRLQGSQAQYAKAHRQLLQGLLLVAAPGLLWAAIAAPDLVPLVLGPAWGHAAPIVASLSLATMLVPYGAAAYWLFVSQDRVGEQLRFGMIGGALLIISILSGIHWGPIGVARSFACFAPFIQGVPLWGATRRGAVRLADILRGTYPIWLGLVLAAVGLVAIGSLPGSIVLHLCGGLGCAYAACGTALLCFPAGQRILGDVWALRAALRPPGG